ncbi:endonuclease domain-containing protein [Microbacterium marinum]|uniref:endonuclease domain-containing protein n=1 Tax=Microbacterium marinum TaxID=421115 RepID=UPI00384BBA6A
MTAARFSLTDAIDWLRQRGGIGRRADLRSAGCGENVIRTLVRDRVAVSVRRAWIALPSADPVLVAAADVGGRVTCLTYARMRGWWMPPGADTGIHLHMRPGGGGGRTPPGWTGTLHWTKPIVAAVPCAQTASVHDALAHIAACVPAADARVIWESASRTERMSPAVLRGVRWPSLAARALAASVEGLSDSGLETIIAVSLRRMGVRVRQQVWIAGRPVDLLAGERLVVQVDGFEFHADSAQRTRDIAHDVELRLRGYTVLRFSYAQVVHDLPAVERMLQHALAQRLHVG